MLEQVYKAAGVEFEWLDLVGPTRSDLEELARTRGLPETAVIDCLDPEHLPKFERFGATAFLILRGHDEESPETADSIQAFTRKVAVFWGPSFFITIHRRPQPFLAHLKARWAARTTADTDADLLSVELLADLTYAVIASYELPLEKAEALIDAFEGHLLGERDGAGTLPDAYRVKRRLNLSRRLLWRTLNLATRFRTANGRRAAVLQDLRENAESMHFYAEELLDDVNNLLNMHLALATHRTNEVVKVLTVFSAFFLPLTFLVGVYGMNFAYMPELTHPMGYPAAWLLMVSVSVVIWLWFRKRRWL
ncbi:MAG: hypothetical protein OEW17_08995 [Gemmatimonadota bacterium]|nr:hypothetical protein [Gemmatimonadota bacterium]MDH4348929.1 hypothetical protein [Gemmatimonadota bacterium]MDH5283817.1 hypothetical protein [Gemmatimonadota bacterium]